MKSLLIGNYFELYNSPFSNQLHFFTNTHQQLKIISKGMCQNIITSNLFHKQKIKTAMLLFLVIPFHVAGCFKSAQILPLP